jgi:hypothetical protein
MLLDDLRGRSPSRNDDALDADEKVDGIEACAADAIVGSARGGSS